jgi:hypothetical protein
MVQNAMQEVFGISMSLGTVNKLRLEASKAVASCVDEAKLYIQSAQIVGADETSFNQGNIDGGNPSQRKAWLWVALTPLVTFFEIALTRCTQGAKNLVSVQGGRRSLSKRAATRCAKSVPLATAKKGHQMSSSRFHSNCSIHTLRSCHLHFY